MKKTGVCPKCGSNEIAANIVVPDYHDHGLKRPQKIDVATTPQNFIFKGIQGFEMRAWICTDCGFTEQYLHTPKAFARAHHQGEANKPY